MADHDNTLRGRSGLHLELSGTAMKVYGCAAMLCYDIGRAVFQHGLAGLTGLGPEEMAAALEADPRLLMLSGWASTLQLIGVLAVPVFAFLLVEGFLHTADFKRYLLTMLGFAIVSEAPYDLAMNGAAWDLGGQNTLFTNALCLIMLYGLGLAEEHLASKGAARRLSQGFIVAATLLWSMLLRSAFGLATVLLAAIYYLWREKKGTRVLLGCAVSAMYVTAPLSGFAIWIYNGRRGKLAGKYKYVFYALYPAHLLVLWLLARTL